MATLINPKKVTHPVLDHHAKNRLIGNDYTSSSGSEHSGYGVDDSPRLSELIDDFFHLNDVETPESSTIVSTYTESTQKESLTETSSYHIETIETHLKRYINKNAIDTYKKLLSLHVSKAVQAFTYIKNHDMQLFRRNVMFSLRQMGHNAAVCKTKWDSSGGLTAGNYEFVDVINRWKRYFIDLDFASEFEIARATEDYARLLKVLPSVFVGYGEELKSVVKLMSDEAKRSFKKRELTLPPWRKNRFMQNKWFGPYRRTVNPVRDCRMSSVNAVMCRRVGFNDGVNSNCFVKTK